MQENLDTSVKIELKEEEISVKEDKMDEFRTSWSRISIKL